MHFEEKFLEKCGGEPHQKLFPSAECENTIPSVCTQSFPPQIALPMRENPKMLRKSNEAFAVPGAPSLRIPARVGPSVNPRSAYVDVQTPGIRFSVRSTITLNVLK
jgi:hypothetical protein